MWIVTVAAAREKRPVSEEAGREPVGRILPRVRLLL